MPLFGGIKQLQIVLESQFNAKHHWIKTADRKAKIDAMFFKATPRDAESNSKI